MKKYSKVFICLAVFGLLFGASSVRAEDSTIENRRMEEGKLRPMLDRPMNDDRKALLVDLKNTREENRQKMEAARQAFMEKLKTDRETFKAEVEKRKAEFRLANREEKREFWGNVGEMVGQRFAQVIKQLEEAQTRVGTVIEKLKNDGHDTEDATNYLDLSKEKLDNAKTKIAEVRALLPATGEEITPEIFAAIKLGAREAKDLLKESRENLLNAIREIKILKGEEDNN